MEIDKKALKDGASTMSQIAANLLGKKLAKEGQLLLTVHLVGGNWKQEMRV